MHTEQHKASRIKRFLTCMVATGGNVTLSAKAARLSTMEAYTLRRQDPDFRAAWDLAKDLSTVTLEDEASYRAMFGHKRPIFYCGKVVGHVRDKSDLLLMFLLKGRKPETYRERYEVQHQAAAPNRGPIVDVIADSVKAADLLLTAAHAQRIEPATQDPKDHEEPSPSRAALDTNGSNGQP